jgi:cytochrome b561
MAEDMSRTRYGGVAQLFHWATAILVLIAFIYGPGGPEDRVYALARDPERRLHETLGLCVFALVVLRVLWRLVDQRPATPPMARWMHLSSRAVQGLLYVLMFAVPLTAIAGAWLAGHPLTLLGGVDVPPWVSESHDVGVTIAELHGWLGDAILWLAGLHAAAAIYHHAFLRDSVLVSMLPNRFGAPEPKRQP